MWSVSRRTSPVPNRLEKRCCKSHLRYYLLLTLIGFLLFISDQEAPHVAGFSLARSQKKLSIRRLPYSIRIWGSTDDEEDAVEVDSEPEDLQKRIEYGNLELLYSDDDDGSDEQPKHVNDWEEYTNGQNGISVDGYDGEKRAQSVYDVNEALQSQVNSLAERLDKQQQHMEKLVQIIKTLKESDTQSSTNTLETRARQSDHEEELLSFSSQNPISRTAPVAPVKAMLFVDGTWLYYSLYEREEGRCPIRQKYGIGWHKRYRVDWSKLPRAICRALNDRGWSSSEGRPIEIVRANVFTSYKKDTLSTSLRYQMFEEMKEANYDVNQMVTVANKEKCIDIQLAVEMLHYATVPNAYDVAILLTGDKDFLPAMVRTRQKGRKVALVSMRPGCNQALRISNGIKDYDDIWLEDHLDEILVEKEFAPVTEGVVSWYTIAKILKDYIEQSGGDTVNSRDVGRYLQCLTIGNETLLQKFKDGFGGIRTFASISNIFAVVERPRPPPGRSFGVSAGGGPDKSFWIKVLPGTDEELEAEYRKTRLSSEEESFFEQYNTYMLRERQTAYYYTLQDQEYGRLPKSRTMPEAGDNVSSAESIDYSTWTVAQLKERCRERNLSMSGLKADLIERVSEDAKTDQSDHSNFWKHWTTRRDEFVKPPNFSEDVAHHLQGLVKEYLTVCGGTASSRDIGRILQQYKSSDGRSSALEELKANYGSFTNFIDSSSDLYSRDDCADGNGFLVIDRSRNL
mmetsp:Transcript_4339/g.11912  ORF Transcript_4339/g.11912 Transcript_4339/m.11912 type:complete len:739 (-) Transcript_4339:884-3100(-)